MSYLFTALLVVIICGYFVAVEMTSDEFLDYFPDKSTDNNRLLSKFCFLISLHFLSTYG